MSPSNPATSHLFVVRIWQEGDPPTPGLWRGSVEHVPSGQRLYFTTLQDLGDFIVFKSDFPISMDQGGIREDLGAGE